MDVMTAVGTAAGEIPMTASTKSQAITKQKTKKKASAPAAKGNATFGKRKHHKTGTVQKTNVLAESAR